MSVPIVVEASGDAEQMTIVVANHGNAIPEHALPTLFDLLTGGDTSNRSGTAARTGSRSRLPLHCQVRIRAPSKRNCAIAAPALLCACPVQRYQARSRAMVTCAPGAR